MEESCRKLSKSPGTQATSQSGGNIMKAGPIQLACCLFVSLLEHSGSNLSFIRQVLCLLSSFFVFCFYFHVCVCCVHVCECLHTCECIHMATPAYGHNYMCTKVDV